MCCSVLPCVAVRYSVLHAVRMWTDLVLTLLGLDLKHCNTLCIPQHTTTHCSTPQHTATHCNTLQHTAIRPILTGLFCKKALPSQDPGSHSQDVLSLMNIQDQFMECNQSLGHMLLEVDSCLDSDFNQYLTIFYRLQPEVQIFNFVDGEPPWRDAEIWMKKAYV